MLRGMAEGVAITVVPVGVSRTRVDPVLVIIN